MLSPRWRKILRDLWGNKMRTVLVVLSIAVGVFAVGMIAGSQVVFTRELNQSWTAVNPYDAQVFADLFDDELLGTVRNMPEVQDADGRRSFAVRFKADPEDDQWRNLIISNPDLCELRSTLDTYPLANLQKVAREMADNGIIEKRQLYTL